MSNDRANRYLEMPIEEFTAESCAERIGIVLRQWSGDMRNATKRIGRRIGADPRVVKNYLYGTHCPPVAKLIEMMADCEPLVQEVNKMVTERRAERLRREG